MGTTKKRLAIIGATTAVAIAGAGAGFAYFTSTGSGTGSGTVGSATDWNVSSTTDQNDITYTAMYPGNADTDQTVHVTITNDGKGYQQLHKFVISVAASDGTAWTNVVKDSSDNPKYPSEAACSADDFALGTQTTAGEYTVDSTVDTTTPLPDDLAPGASYTYDVNLHMLDTGVAQDNCQGASPQLYISAS
jgi:hypothetical protein